MDFATRLNVTETKSFPNTDVNLYGTDEKCFSKTGFKFEEFSHKMVMFKFVQGKSSVF